jgi:4-amino-4-deoxy-L-arabinose transferase-like glycosyltransferase
VLTLMGRFVYLGRMLTPDSILCLCLVVSWMACHLSLVSERPRWGWLLLSATACGLGILTKGPVAVVLMLMPTAIWCYLQGRTLELRWHHGLVWGTVVLLLAGPWFVAMCTHEPQFAQHFFWTHNVLRYVSPFVHAEPFWFYLPWLAVGTLPWCLALPGVGATLLRSVANPAWFWLLAFTWCLVFFSCSGCKRAVYIVPAFPPLALAIGSYLNRRLSDYRQLCVFGAAAGASYVVLFIGTWFLLPGYSERFSLRNQLQQLETTGKDPGVICFPRRWDSVSFYLRRDDIRCYSSEQIAELHADLIGRPETVMILKPGEAFDLFLSTLPPTLEFEPSGHAGLAITGWVRHR